ncbi:MAG: thiamine biosynthesis lipoprotein [Lentimonas sp.]|jgi:thiamine biosynthesis lipoprotein
MRQTHSFQHDAMKTTFTLRIVSDDTQQAKAAAHACIELIDELENKLSRYIEGSDVDRINHMQAGQTLLLSDICDDCLRIALEAYQQTGGLFDITLGQQIEHQKNKLAGPRPELTGQLMVDPNRPAVHCSQAGREIDLGGIGKGYALDRMKRLIEEWGIEEALVSAGGSTQLAIGHKAWKIELTGDHASRTIELQNQALSASGTGIQGSHIVSPRTTEINYAHTRIWLIDETAALADAWSTAAMLMDKKELLALATAGARVFVENENGIEPLAATR